jgi:hypothetical protein
MEVTIHRRELASLVLAFGHYFEPLNFFRWDHPHSQITYSFEYERDHVAQHAQKLDLILWQRMASEQEIKAIAQRACERARFARLTEIERNTQGLNLSFLFYQRRTHLLRLPKHFLTAPVIWSDSYKSADKFSEFVLQWLMARQTTAELSV